MRTLWINLLLVVVLLLLTNKGNPFSLDDGSKKTFHVENQNNWIWNKDETRSVTEYNDQLTTDEKFFTNELGSSIKDSSYFVPSSFREAQEGKKNTELVFEPPPEGELYETLNSVNNDEICVFAYLGQFFSFIQPYDFPAEFLRDVLWNRLSIVSLIFQSLRVEAGFVACVTIGVLLSLVVPAFAAASSCSNLCVPRKPVSESASMSGVDNPRKSLIFGLFCVVLIIGSGISAMLITNEQLSSAMLATPRVVSLALNDVSAYVRNTQRQMHHVTIGAWSKVTERLFNELNEIEELLGNPIKAQIAAETGMDVALDALFDIATVTENLSKKVAELQETNLKLRELLREAANRLADLRHQVESLRRACDAKDRPLCVTIDSTGLDIALRTDALNTDPRLNVLRSMMDKNLPLSVQRVRQKFADIPLWIDRETSGIRGEIKNELDMRKKRLDTAMDPFEAIAKNIRIQISDARQLATSIDETVNDIEQWRWLSFFSTAILVLLIWILFAMALIYSCCDRESKSRSILIAGLVLASLLSIILWTIALAVMLVGGHGEVFICRPLYDEPDYKSLSELIDDPGVIYSNGGGFFKNLVSRNQALDVPIKSILGECKANRTAYTAFRLNNVISIQHLFNSWDTIFQSFHRFQHNQTQLNFLEIDLQNKLQSLLQATSVNMTLHRSQISRSATGKDLTWFAKQLDSVANQIKDLSTASRVESIASRARRIITTNIQPLETKKEEILYQITALELQMTPLQRQVNQSISHLKTIQFYIDNQSEKIFKMKSEEYCNRMMDHLNKFRQQLLDGLDHSVAGCWPIFNIFNAIRHHMCRKTMDPLNGFWFALVWALFGLLIATPVAINLIYHYGNRKEGILHSHGGSVSSAERSNVWNTPGSQANSDDNW